VASWFSRLIALALHNEFAHEFPDFPCHILSKRAKLFSTTNQFSWFIEFALAKVCVLSRDFAEHIVFRSDCRFFLINTLPRDRAHFYAFLRRNRRYFASFASFSIDICVNKVYKLSHISWNTTSKWFRRIMSIIFWRIVLWRNWTE